VAGKKTEAKTPEKNSTIKGGGLDPAHQKKEEQRHVNEEDLTTLQVVGTRGPLPKGSMVVGMSREGSAWTYIGLNLGPNKYKTRPKNVQSQGKKAGNSKRKKKKWGKTFRSVGRGGGGFLGVPRHLGEIVEMGRENHQTK